jgi:hypothetical protein
MKAPLLAAVLALTCASCERTSQSFATYDELVQRNALQSGWFPAWLPASSHDIREAHDIDTNQSMLSAQVGDPSWRLPASCHAVATAPKAPFSKDWWPADLTQESGWRLFSCAPGEYAATRSAQNLVLHWRPDGS